jgi:hypothetical protein
MKSARHLGDWALRRWSVALVLAVAAWSVYHTMLNHDVAYYLLLARGLDEGRELYKTFPDYGLPANGWLAFISLHVSSALALPLVETHQCILFLLAATGAITAGRILERLFGRETVAGRTAMPLTVAIFLLYPGYNFGQRDYLFAVLVAPLVMTVAGRHLGLRPGAALSVVVVLTAMIGGSFKPQFALPLIMLAGIELTLRRGRLRAVAREVWVAGGGLIAYVALVHILYPAYFTEVLPSAVVVYGSYTGSLDRSLLRHLVQIFVSVIIAICLVVFYLRAQWSERPSYWLALTACWFVFGASLLAMFVLQRQGFIYHLLPFGLFVSISIGGFALLLLDRSSVLKSASPVVLSTTLALAIIAGASATAAPKPELSRASVLEDPLGRALRQLPARTPVLILSTGVPPQSPNHAYADIRWTGAFGALTEMAAIVKDRDAARKEGRPRVPALVAVEQDLRRRVLLSLAAPHPEMIFIDVSPTLRWFEHYDRPIGILSFLREDPRFTAAWSDYEFQTEMPTLFGTTVKAYKRR